MRDAQGARQDLENQGLAYKRRELQASMTGQPRPSPFGALVFTCNGRGRHLYGEPHWDSRRLADFVPVPSSGFFCNGGSWLPCNIVPSPGILGNGGSGSHATWCQCPPWWCWLWSSQAASLAGPSSGCYDHGGINLVMKWHLQAYMPCVPFKACGGLVWCCSWVLAV